MITLENVTATFGTRFSQELEFLSSANLQIPSGRRMAVFSENPKLTRSLINLLAGLSLPAKGKISRSGRVSFPIGHLGAFDQDLSIRHNVEFSARLYGAEIDSVVEFVRKFSRLNDAFEKPFGRLTQAQKRRVDLIIAYSIPFELYVHVSDMTLPSIRKQLGNQIITLIEARLSDAGIIVPARHLRDACEVCDTAIIMHGGALYLINDIRDAAIALKEISVANQERTPPNFLRKFFGRGF